MKGLLKVRLNRTSLVRLLPALLVALLPFPTFDRALLRSLYTVRGPIKPHSSTRIFLAQNPYELQKLANEITRTHSAPCWAIGTAPLHNSSCRFVNIRDLFTEPSLRDAISLKHELLFYGRLPDLYPVDAELALSKPNTHLAGAQGFVLLDASYHPKIPILTPAGLLDQGEWLVNAALNSLEGRSLQPVSNWMRWIFPSSLTLITALITYSYPAILTLVLAVILGALAYVVSFLAFDAQGLQLPLAAAWSSLLTVILLGMGDRLDRRERREWTIERDAENLKSLDEMRNNFLSLVSHDLKTPIAKILSLLDRFSQNEFGPVNPQQRLQLEKIISTSGYLQRTISTLLLLSRIESSDFRIHRTPSDLTLMLEKAIHQHRPQATERNIQIRSDLEPLFLVDLDPALIFQVMNNLLENALKYSPGNTTVTVRCRESENCVELSPPQPGVWFEIQDEGAGIRLEDRERVLQKFARGSAESTATDQSVKGTGLGLYLAKFFVEKHGGTITLISKARAESLSQDDVAYAYFSEEQSGTVLRVTLPLGTPVVDLS